MKTIRWCGYKLVRFQSVWRAYESESSSVCIEAADTLDGLCSALRERVENEYDCIQGRFIQICNAETPEEQQ